MNSIIGILIKNSIDYLITDSSNFKYGTMENSRQLFA